MRDCLLWIVLVVAVLAMAEKSPAVAGGLPTEGLAAERMSGDVSWRTGGVGGDERATLQRTSGNYNLKLVFAEEKSLAFVADVTVRIESESGEPKLETGGAGPWLFARLPAGGYRVTAIHGGAAQTQAVRVGESGQAELRFYWPGSSR